MQKLSLIGTVGNVRRNTLPDGKPVVNINLYVNDYKKNASGGYDSNDVQYSLTYFTDKELKWLDVGAKMYAEGTPRIETYTNKDGVLVSKILMIVHTAEFINESSKKTIQRHMNTLQQGTPVSNVQEYQSAPTDFVTEDGQPIDSLPF